jgi:cytidylate kinase
MAFSYARFVRFAKSANYAEFPTGTINMPSPSIIAIDGPAASGKSTLGLKLAQALGYLFFDTGVMYRAVTWLALKLDIDPRDETRLTALAEQTQIDVAPASREDGRVCDILIAGEDITWETRLPEVEANVSVVSAYRGVRAALGQQQRRIGQQGRVVMVGRDIGTVVLPEADLKIYLDASAEERAKRRYDEIIARGGAANYDEILAKVIERDRIDSTRDVAPLKPAADAVTIDSDKLDIAQVFEKVVALCQ